MIYKEEVNLFDIYPKLQKVNIKIENEKLITQITGQPEFELIALNDSTFKVSDVDAKVIFRINEDGTVNEAILEQNGRHKLEKLPDYSPGISELKEYEGEYLNKQLETIYSLKIKDSSLVASHINLEEIKMEPIEKDSFNGSIYFMGKIIFNRNKKGEIESFSVSNGRTKDILFVKQ